MADFSLPYGKPANIAGAFMGGMQGVQDLQTGALRQQALKQQVDQQKMEQPIRMAAAAAQYWDMTKATLTPETYGAWREQTIKMFPMIPESEFPPREAFKTPEQFEAFKWQKETKIAELKRMAQWNKVVGPEQTLVGPNGPIFQGPPSQARAAATQEQQRMNDWRMQHGGAQLAQGAQRIAQTQQRIDNPRVGGMTGKGPTEPISEESKRAEGLKYLITNKLPFLGMAGGGRMEIMNEGNRLAKELGLTPGKRISMPAIEKSMSTALTNLEKQRAIVLSFEDTATRNLGIVEELSKKVDRTGVPIWNKWVQSGKRAVTGDPDLTAFDASIRTAINEVAKVTTSATGAGQLSDTARKEVEENLKASHNPKQVMAAIGILKRDMENRRIGYANKSNELRGNLEILGDLKGSGSLNAAPEGASPAPQMVTIRNKATGETMNITHDEAVSRGFLK